MRARRRAAEDERSERQAIVAYADGMRLVLVIVVASLVGFACGANPEASPAARPPAAPSATTAPAPASAASASADEARCKQDAECTFVALGCCSTTAVNRESAAHVKRRLVASGLPECPPKAACGPGRDGTWEGTAGTCREGRCVGGPE